MQPRARKNRINYSENEFLKASLKAATTEKVKGPRLTKMPQLQDFQFFDVARIEALYSIEHAHETYKFQLVHKRTELDRNGMSSEQIEEALLGCVSTYL